MRAIVTLLILGIVGCGSAAGNTGNFPAGDTSYSTDSKIDGTETETHAQQNDSTEVTASCVDMRVNDYIYDCQDGNPETPITADPETCKYYADMWSSKPEKTQVLDGAKRVIAKTGVFTRDCVYKRKK